MEARPDVAKLSAGFFRSLCEQSPAALIAADAEMNILVWNEAATRLLGRTEVEMVGRPMIEIARPDRRGRLHRLIGHTLRDGIAREFELHDVDEQGDARALLAVFSGVRGESGQVRAVAAWVRDITNRKDLAERLAASEKMASLGTLAGGVAHHFHNILGGVTTAVDFALTGHDPAACRKALQMTADAIGRVTRLTQGLLSFAEQDNRRIDLADLTETVLTFVHLMERPLAERGIRLETDLGAVPIFAVEANRMHQVLGNLLTNAEEAMADGGTIRIATGCDDRSVWLDFADTGCGIAREHLPLVFEPFFTTKGLLAGGDSGNPGLGLSVAHGIVTELGGDIVAASDGRTGTSFRIRFPKPCA